MLIRKLLPLALLFAASCSAGRGSIPVDSGIEGYMTIGPSCPVVQVGNPCPDKPYEGRVSILTADARRKVAEAEADATGFYRIMLPPGSYILHPESSGVFPQAADIPVAVLAHEITRQDISYDSGIR